MPSLLYIPQISTDFAISSHKLNCAYYLLKERAIFLSSLCYTQSNFGFRWTVMLFTVITFSSLDTCHDLSENLGYRVKACWLPFFVVAATNALLNKSSLSEQESQKYAQKKERFLLQRSYKRYEKKAICMNWLLCKWINEFLNGWAYGKPKTAILLPL